MNLSLEVQRTNPDFVVYRPPSIDRSSHTTGNEHFLVEKLGSGRLLAVWTRSSYEGADDQHVVVANSLDDGKTWTAPRKVVGPGENLGMASWGFQIVSASGRVYLFFFRHVGTNDVFTHTTGLLTCVSSDDDGMTWSDEVRLDVLRSCWDNPDSQFPPNCIVWQKPIRLDDGRRIVGLTRWVSPAIVKPVLGDWWAAPSVVEFMRFENIDEDPRPEDLKITFLATNEHALRVGLRGHPDVPLLQEPSIVVLPDGRLFCVMRTTLGSPYYSISENAGEAWTEPLPLRQYDDGPILPHPLSPCPIYDAGESEYLFLYHNHDGHFLTWTPADTSFHRRPVCLARGAFRPEADQPIWFSDPWYFMDNGGVPILRSDLSMYASLTTTSEGAILWYPDRKFFLLGKKISRNLLQELRVPQGRDLIASRNTVA